MPNSESEVPVPNDPESSVESEAPVPNSESCIGGVAGVATSPVYLAGVSTVGRGTGEVGIAPMVTHTTQAGSPLHRLKIAAPVLDLCRLLVVYHSGNPKTCGANTRNRNI